MKLSPEAREAVDAAMAEAHDETRPTREIAARVVEAIREMEPAGLPWVTDLIDEFAIVGAMKLCADWRRNHRTEAVTKRGTAVSVPTFAGVTSPTGEAVQMHFAGMSLEEIKTRYDRVRSTRNTLSAEVQLLANLIEVMEADATVGTAGEAMDRLMAKAA